MALGSCSLLLMYGYNEQKEVLDLDLDGFLGESLPRDLHGETPDAANLNLDGQLELFERCGLELQVPEFHRTAEYGDLHLLGVEPFNPLGHIFDQDGLNKPLEHGSVAAKRLRNCTRPPCTSFLASPASPTAFSLLLARYFQLQSTSWALAIGNGPEGTFASRAGARRFTNYEAPEVLSVSPDAVHSGDKVSLSVDKLIASTCACVKLVAEDLSIVVSARVDVDVKTVAFEFPDLALQQDEVVEVLFSVNGQDFPFSSSSFTAATAAASIDSESRLSEPRRFFLRFQPADATPT